MGYEEKFLHGLLLLTECTKTSQLEQHWTWGAPPIKTKILGSIEIVPEQNRMLLCLCRAVATGLVSPVSTGPLFPSLVAYLVLPIIAQLLGGRLRNAPKHIGTMLKLAKWLRTMRQNCSASLPSDNFSFLQVNNS